MSAYQLAATRNAKLQILSIYANRYPTETLIKLHEPYGKITKWQIKKARAHANLNGPGEKVEKIKQNRIRIDRTKLDHFIDFANRPYFYQDVAFGTRKLKLDSGSKLTIPNVIRNVTRSTLISQYMQYCEDQKVEPLTCATLFRILKIREASERKFLHGVDNIAADGSSGIEMLKQIVSEMEKLGVGKEWAKMTVQKLNSAKVYLKSDYLVHCKEESPCPDHCRHFALSDPTDKLLQESCDHEHSLFCDRCEDLKQVISDIEEAIQKNSNIVVKKQEQTDIQEDDGFFKFNVRAMKEDKQMAEDDESNAIECTVPGCEKVFKCFENLEIHLSAGNHTNTLENETLYDSLRKKWANKFQTIDINQMQVRYL
ncbi:Retrovirus-related Pol poly [Paramuricea clavata]|uniref:Retrovirus-related Pol poly n=1 Tax=Paramuricea clavata TaxID=317549 RepID=A0A6S7H4C3_PARCT|nr:Retrovirus-related Pol poly [Paramuricea clavata]